MSSSWIQALKDNSRRLFLDKRMKQEFMQSIGITDSTDDPAFDVRIRKFRHLNESCTSLSLAATSYLNSLQSFINASTVLSNEFSRFFDSQMQYEETTNCSLTLSACAQHVKGIQLSMDQHIRPTIESVIRKNILIPIAELSHELQQIDRKLEHRKLKLLDFDSYRRLLESKRNSLDLDRQREKMTFAEEALQSISYDITHHFNDLDRRSPNMFREEFTAFIACQQCLPIMPSIGTVVGELAYLGSKKSHSYEGTIDYQGVSSNPSSKASIPCQPHPIVQLLAFDTFCNMHTLEGMPKATDFPTTSSSSSAPPLIDDSFLQ